MTDKEKKYLMNDVLIMVEALEAMEKFGITDKLTIGSKTLDEYKNLIGYWGFKDKFPELNDDIDKFIRKSYKGGWCYCKNPRVIYTDISHFDELKTIKREVVKISHGEVYDVNSLYPFSMHSDDKEPHAYPVGEPMYFEGESEFMIIQEKREWIVRFQCSLELLPKHLPSLTIKESKYGENEFLETTNGEIIELTLTRPDFELMWEQYEVTSMKILDGYYFVKGAKLFDEFIDYWYNIKSTATDKATRAFAKLMLNSLYGKFATSSDAKVKVPKYEDGQIKLSIEERPSKKSGYIPVGAYITAYARCKTIRAAQTNYEIFLYADTDSIHCTGKASGIEIDPKKLGAWKNESGWKVASFIRQKTYIEYTDQEDCEKIEPHWIIKACGAPEECKERIQHEVTRKEGKKWIHDNIIKDENDKILNKRRSVESLVKFFDIGMEEGGKLLRKTVKGGTILIPGCFTMR